MNPRFPSSTAFLPRRPRDGSAKAGRIPESGMRAGGLHALPAMHVLHHEDDRFAFVPDDRRVMFVRRAARDALLHYGVQMPNGMRLSKYRVVTAAGMAGLLAFARATVARSTPAAAQRRGGQEQADRQQIEQLTADFVKAYNALDARALVEAYSAALVYMPQGFPTLEGADGVREAEQRMRDVFARADVHLEVRLEEVEVSGDMAFDRGVLTVTSAQATGETQKMTRRFMEILRKETSGRWKVYRAMNNSAN